MDFSTIINWLDSFKTWVVDIFTGLLSDVINVFLDLFIWCVDKLFWLVSMAFSFIPSPDLTSGVTLYSLFASLPSVVGWLVVKLRLPEAMLIMVNGGVFYILRRLLTLGIW